jgi:sugar phosphate isomerase/epimerase
MSRYAFSTAALYPLESDVALGLIKKAGFKYAELMPQAFSDITDEFADKALDTGVQVSSVHYPLAMFALLYTSHPAMSEDGYRFGSDIVRLCTKLGAGVLVIHPHIPPAEEHRAILEPPIIKNMVYLADLCYKNNIRLAMENSPKGDGKTGEALIKYISTFKGHPAIHPMVDTTEACEAYQDPAEFIKTVKPIHLHLSDYKDDKKHLPAGQGSIDWKALKSALSQVGYEGYYTLEPSYRYYINDTENRLKEAYDFIQNLIEG